MFMLLSILNQQCILHKVKGCGSKEKTRSSSRRSRKIRTSNPSLLQKNLEARSHQEFLFQGTDAMRVEKVEQPVDRDDFLFPTWNYRRTDK
jgi:hypothetical protein